MGKKKKYKKSTKTRKICSAGGFRNPAKIFATLRKFRNAGNFQKVAKISQRCEILQSCENFANFAKFPVCENCRNFRRGCKIFATLAKMIASLFLASATSRLCFDDLLSALFLH